MGRLPSDGLRQRERQLSRTGVSQAQPEHGAGDLCKVPTMAIRGGDERQAYGNELPVKCVDH